ncbi:MAG: GIN domain-containing protein [Mucilaginibacter sp.]
MKTKILPMIMLFAVMTGSAKITSAAVAANSNNTVLNDIKAINKIEVRGNVQLFISDRTPEQVTVYNKYYAQNALVQSKNGVLRISSYSAVKLVVWVSSQNLQSVSAYDNAEIRSFGDVAKVQFNIDLHDNAIAKLRFDAHNVRVTVRDNATAELSGRVDEFGMDRNTSAIVLNTGLSVGRNIENTVVETGKQALVGA